MSRAFVKEDSGDGIEDLPDLPVSGHPNHVTPGGLADLRARLREAVGRLEAATARKGEIEGRQGIAVARRDIRYLEARVASAILVDPAGQPEDRVAFGAAVAVVDEEDVQSVFRIVGEDEADPERGLVAPPSPLARALMGAGIGDVVTWAKPSGAVELEVVGIGYPEG